MFYDLCFFITILYYLPHDHTSLYSYFDEMSSSDPELYKNLTYVKHYEGDVEDLGLTFSFDQVISLGNIIQLLTTVFKYNHSIFYFFL